MKNSSNKIIISNILLKIFSFLNKDWNHVLLLMGNSLLKLLTPWRLRQMATVVCIAHCSAQGRWMICHREESNTCTSTASITS